MSAAEEVIPSELPKPAKRVQNRTGRVQNRTGRKQVRPSRAEEMQAKRKQQKEEAIDTRRTQRQAMIVSEELMADSAQVAAQHKRTVQDAVFPTSDADRKRVTRSVAAQVAAQHKRTVQDAVFLKLPAATMKVKMWGMQSLRVLFHNPDLTEQDFMAALESDALTEMVATIADDQVFRMKIRIALSTFNGEWEGHVNHVTRAP